MDAVGDVLEVFGGWREGRQRKVASVRGWMQSRMFLRFSVLDVDEGRQRMEASVRSGCSRGCFRSFWGMERGTSEEGGIGPGVDAVEDVFEVFSIGCGRGTPEEGGIGPGRDSVGGYY